MGSREIGKFDVMLLTPIFHIHIKVRVILVCHRIVLGLVGFVSDNIGGGF